MNIKHIILSIFFANLISISNAEEMVEFYSCHIAGEKVTYSYPLSKIKMLPKWDMKSETPIPFNTALKKVWDYAEQKYPEVELFLEEVELDPNSYPVDEMPNAGICWVYYFEFLDKKEYGRLSGKIIMLMDGTIIEPVPSKK